VKTVKAKVCLANYANTVLRLEYIQVKCRDYLRDAVLLITGTSAQLFALQRKSKDEDIVQSLWKQGGYCV
jgi:hypothetical protein